MTMSICLSVRLSVRLSVCRMSPVTRCFAAQSRVPYFSCRDPQPHEIYASGGSLLVTLINAPHLFLECSMKVKVNIGRPRPAIWRGNPYRFLLSPSPPFLLPLPFFPLPLSFLLHLSFPFPPPNPAKGSKGAL